MLLPSAEVKPWRAGSGWAGRTVGAMDGAIEPPWMGSRRVLPAHPDPANP